MTNDERISAYIDNELTVDQEQELLISLAASDTLRKTFRSELVMQNILHTDAQAVAPPRAMRGAVLAAVGLAAVATASTADAATVASHGATGAVGTGLHAIKALFATKVSALLTVCTLSVVGVAGYGVRLMTTPVTASQVTSTQDVPAATIAPSSASQVTPDASTHEVLPERSATSQGSAMPSSSATPAMRSAANQPSAPLRTMYRSDARATTPTSPAASTPQGMTPAGSAHPGVVGGGEILMRNPIPITKHK